MKLISKNTFTFLFITAVAASGVYNTLEMNSKEFLNFGMKNQTEVIEFSSEEFDLEVEKKSYQFEKSNVLNFKREAPQFKKVDLPKAVKTVENNDIANDEPAYIQEDISLHLIEYYNPNKFSTILKVGDNTSPVNGVLEAANGVVEKIDITLPDGESLFVEYGEMKENRFTYTAHGEKLRGIIYKVDAKTYMVSLDEGPHAGTRMKFQDSRDLDTTYDKPVDAKIVEASIAAQNNGFVF